MDAAPQPVSWDVLLLAVLLLFGPAQMFSQKTVVLQSGRKILDLYNNSVSS